MKNKKAPVSRQRYVNCHHPDLLFGGFNVCLKETLSCRFHIGHHICLAQMGRYSKSSLGLDSPNRYVPEMYLKDS